MNDAARWRRPDTYRGRPRDLVHPPPNKPEPATLDNRHLGIAITDARWKLKAIGKMKGVPREHLNYWTERLQELLAEQKGRAGK